MNINQQLTGIILVALNNALKPKQFRRTGQTFSRTLPEVVHMVGLQKSMTNTSNHVKATINLAIWVPSLAPIRGGKPDPPNIISSPWCERLGFLMPEHTDVWWSFSDENEANAAAAQIVDALLKWGLPALEGIKNEQELLEQWEAGYSHGLTEKQRISYLQRLKAVRSDR